MDTWEMSGDWNKQICFFPLLNRQSNGRGGGGGATVATKVSQVAHESGVPLLFPSRSRLDEPHLERWYKNPNPARVQISPFLFCWSSTFDIFWTISRVAASSAKVSYYYFV